jgi:hypothetical protein
MGGGHPSTLSVDNLSPPPPVRRGRVISQPVPDMVRPSASGEDPPPAEVPPVAFGDAPPVEPASNPPAATTDDLEAARHCTSRAIVDEPLERVEPPERARRKRSPPLHSGAECAGYPAPCDCIRCPSCGGGGATPGWDNCPTCGGGGSVPGGRL